MKKSILLSLIFLMSLSSSTFAQKTTPADTQEEEKITSKPTIDPKMEKIQELKQRIATKVAEMKILKKRVFVGKITELDNPYIIIAIKEGDKKIETDEDTVMTQITNGKSQKIAFKQLKKDQTIFTWGSYNQEGDILTAKSIVAKEEPIMLYGTITEIDLKGGTITLQTVNQTYVLDVEVFTKINSADNKKQPVKLGFSKIKKDSPALIQAVTILKKDEITYTANRILVLPSMTANVTPVTTPSVEPTISQSPTPSKNPIP